MKKIISLLVVSCFTAALAFAGAAESKPGKCCAAAAKDGKACAHKCCVDAAKDGKNCTKCGGSGDIAKAKK